MLRDKKNEVLATPETESSIMYSTGKLKTHQHHKQQTNAKNIELHYYTNRQFYIRVVRDGTAADLVTD